MKRILTVIGVLMLCSEAMAQSTRLSQEAYISLVAPIAIEQQQLYGIPASITIAQGIIESGSGNSWLATEANNHFGIKCKNTWTGDKVYRTDDAPDECFRKYGSVEESYVDHSLFLRGNERYDSLFLLNITDYEGWANCLKRKGYATDPSYPRKLIDKIETFGLDRLDLGVIPTEYQLTTTQPSLDLIDKYGTLRRTGKPLNQTATTSQRQDAVQQPVTGQSTTQQPAAQLELQPLPSDPQRAQSQQMPQQQAQQPQMGQRVPQQQTANDGLLHYRVGRFDGRRYIVAYRGDTYGVLARMVGLSEDNLRLYNNATDGSQPRGGDYIFIQKGRGLNAPSI